MKIRFALRNYLAACCVLLALASYAQPAFINRIPIPPLLDASNGTIELELSQHLHKFNPNDLADDSLNGSAAQGGIDTWAYNKVGSDTMTMLGPTLLWTTGDSIHIKITNNITQETTVHWHGAEIPADIDGGPHEPFLPLSTWPVDFKNLDSSSTMWYHPHMHDNTFPQVTMGLAGMVISKEANDAINPVLPHLYGEDDFPIIISELAILRDTVAGGVIEYGIDTTKVKRPYNLVNGVTNPYLTVRPHMVRLRILNGSSRKGMQIGFSSGYNDPISSLLDFYQVATDGGYTLIPNTLQTMLLGPGERVELVLDMTGQPAGSEFYLRNLKQLMPGYIVGSPLQAPPPGNGGADSTSGNAFLKIIVAQDTIIPGYTFTDTPPAFTSQWDPAIADTNDITGRRTKVLMHNPSGGGFVIDSLSFDMDRIDDIVCLNAKEIWSIKNVSNVAHPFHIHKIFFRILSIDTLNVLGDSIGQVDMSNLGLNGPKDDLLVHKNWQMNFLAYFDHYPSDIMPMNSYMYHCHILTHEDSQGGGMMHQFVVTDQGPCLITGLGENESENKVFRMYPNPTENELFVEVESSGDLRILDMNGKEVLQEKLSGVKGAQQINVSKLKSGIYVVEWTTQDQQFTKKLVLR